MYLNLLKRLALKFVQGIRTLFKIYKMESTKGNKELLSNAKVKSRSIDILMRFKPFRFQVKRIYEYDSYKRISIVTNDSQILLEDKCEN